MNGLESQVQMAESKAESLWKGEKFWLRRGLLAVVLA